jgi:hypothetical protein
VVGYGDIHFTVIVDVGEIHTTTAVGLAREPFRGRTPVTLGVGSEDPGPISQPRDYAQIAVTIAIYIPKCDLGLPNSAAR